jgi:hypothetical protein
MFYYTQAISNHSPSQSLHLYFLFIFKYIPLNYSSPYFFSSPPIPPIQLPLYSLTELFALYIYISLFGFFKKYYHICSTVIHIVI